MPANQQIAAVLWGLGVGAALIVVDLGDGAGRRGSASRSRATARRDRSRCPTPIQPVHDYPRDSPRRTDRCRSSSSSSSSAFVVWAIGYVVLFVQRGFTFS